MKLSLIIPACNEEAYLGATLEAARRAGDVEVLVVDNASTDRTAAVATSFRAKVIQESQRSIARARNAGAANATGDVLVFLDADTIVPERFFQRIGEVLQDSRCLGGSVDLDYQPSRRWVRFYLALWRLVGRLGGMAQGAAQFCRREAFDSLGGYDECLFMGEDVDFYWRLKRLARQDGKLVSFISDLQVWPSPRRFDQWPAWRILIWTNPLFAWFLRHTKSAWRGWYEDLVR